MTKETGIDAQLLRQVFHDRWQKEGGCDEAVCKDFTDEVVADYARLQTERIVARVQPIVLTPPDREAGEE